MGYVDDLAVLAGLAPEHESRQSTNVHAATGIAHGDSSDGRVLVDMGGVSITGDGSQYVSAPTMVDVRDGDEVHVQLVGADGTAKSMVVTGVVGGGDRTRADVDSAASDASQAVDTAGKAADTANTAKQSADAASETAKDAKSTATDARDKADALSTVIHDGADGVSVGRSADGGATYPQGRTRQSGSAFEVLDEQGDAISSLSGDEVSLARGTTFLRTMVRQNEDGTQAPQWSLLTSLLSCPIYIGKRDEAVGYEGDVTPEQLAAYIAFSAAGSASGRIAMHAMGGATLNGLPLLTGPTVLFDNAAQALDTAIHLSDSAANYKRLKIFYATDDNEWSSVEVVDPDGKEVSLWAAHYNHGKQGSGLFSQMWMKSKTVSINGNVIDTSTDNSPDLNYNRGQWNGRSTWEDRDKIGIKRVEGYAW
ncbi:hypothetical protein [Parafannyhessea umbonata]|uniref:hypothetical protein n=1 Tax=Parafannyhessea umbonata TaxID=604330 RepID=UPI00359C6D6C